MKRRVDLLPNLLSLGNMYCGLAAIFAAGAGEIDRAAWFVVLAIFFDAFDGKIARLTGTASEFGKELDSLSDLVSFGIAPALLIYEGIMKGHPRAGALIAAVYATTSALRLARFNVGRASRGKDFIGLPAPAAGGVVASYTLFTSVHGANIASFVTAHGMGIATLLIGPLTLGLALLMVSPIPYPKDRLFEVSRRRAFAMLFVAILALAAFHAEPRATLFLLGLA
ncbi:MAG: CDP-diacylglycerol--serine O-phosphatidyltransferase, partial [Candidatus Hydrogenedentes bacterium]|nr:CDP-diacylglycerol--serine O-phosphatidyltransferase [Candidatus Hydrogenedentota bacterium]